MTDGRTDRQTDGQTDICDSRVAFATENSIIHYIRRGNKACECDNIENTDNSMMKMNRSQSLHVTSSQERSQNIYHTNSNVISSQGRHQYVNHNNSSDKISHNIR